MKSAIFSISLLLLFGGCLPGQERSVWKVAYVKDSQLYAVDSLTKVPRKLTSDNSVKYMPSWSPDGRRIAYLRDETPNIALPLLVVIDEQGKELGRKAPYEGQIPGGNSQSITPRSLSIEGWADNQHVDRQATGRNGL